MPVETTSLETREKIKAAALAAFEKFPDAQPSYGSYRQFEGDSNKLCGMCFLGSALVCNNPDYASGSGSCASPMYDLGISSDYWAGASRGWDSRGNSTPGVKVEEALNGWQDAIEVHAKVLALRSKETA